MQPVVCGSMGEAFHLSHDERIVLFKAAREALDQAGLTETVIIAGTYVVFVSLLTTLITLSEAHLADAWM